jgi:hypothetical protein
MATLGADRVMVTTFGPDGPGLTIAYTATGRIAARIPRFSHNVVAGSPDGRTIYYADSGAIWAVPSTSGPARRLHDGDAVAPSPDGKYLVIQLNDMGRGRLVYLPLDGGKEHEIPVNSPLPLASNQITPNAVAPDGRILVEVGSPGLWFWPPAILNPRNGSVTIVLPGAEADGYAGWSPDGRVVASQAAVQSTLWRFRPVVRSAGQR